MRIHADFIGGNIVVNEVRGADVYLQNDLRDSTTDWFYWAFCVEEAAGQTVTFHLDKDWMGYYGPAISHDLMTWEWQNVPADNAFTYTFAADENKVYFAHNILYHPAHFAAFAAKAGLKEQTFCLSQKGREVPCVTFGEGTKKIILTARHHACESTGNYVLQGVLEELLAHPLDGYEILCVPFMDYDGVVDGDQGKNRDPHDHNRDYLGDDALYPTVQEMQRYIAAHEVVYGFDFHAPWHRGDKNDKSFIVQPNKELLPALDRFGVMLEQHLTPTSFRYEKAEDFPPDFAWNQSTSPTFSKGLLRSSAAKLAFTLETAYFGEPDNNVFTAARGIEFGHCFARTLRDYIAESENG